MLTVDPIVIDPNGFAEVSHSGTGDITVTITNQNGATETLNVPSGTKVKWYPPAGWTEARFNAEGSEEVFRYIRATDAEGEASS